jgi:hypothetical protein
MELQSRSSQVVIAGTTRTHLAPSFNIRFAAS